MKVLPSPTRVVALLSIATEEQLPTFRDEENHPPDSFFLTFEHCWHSPAHSQVYDQCPSSGSVDCLDNANATAVVGCVVTSVAGRVGSSYAARLSGPEAVSGTVEHSGDGLFTAQYTGPIAGEYELEVSTAPMLRDRGSRLSYCTQDSRYLERS